MFERENLSIVEYVFMKANKNLLSFFTIIDFKKLSTAYFCRDFKTKKRKKEEERSINEKYLWR